MKKHIPKISVIMPVYNSAKYLQQAINSVLNEVYTDFELLICNDGSTDSSQEIIDAFAKKDKRIRVYSREINSGKVSIVHQFLTELARGEYIAPTDSDDVCLPHRLETLLAAANKNPDAAVVFGKTRVVDVNDNTLYFYGKKYDPYELFIDNYITNGGLIIRRDIFNKINGYNTEIVWAEDYDLRLRLGLERRFVFVDEEVYVYRMHDQNWTAKKINLDEVNQFRYALFLECKNYVKDMVATIPITYKTMICLRYISAWHAIVGDIEKSVQYKVILEQLLKKDIAAVHALKRMLLPSDG